MRLVGTALNLREKMIIYLSLSAEVLHKTSNMALSRQCCFADDGEEMDKSEKRTCRGVQSYCFCPSNIQICDVLVAVSLVVAQVPH